MTKSTSPAANAGLPAIDRRSMVCGLGAASFLGVPVIAGAASMSDDPVFQAMAALEQLNAYSPAKRRSASKQFELQVGA